VVQRHIRIETPPGRRLDLASLPPVGRRGKSLELRDVRWTEGGWFGAPGHTLTLDYQVFVSPTEVRTIEMPPLTLRFDGGPRPEDLRIDAWPMTLAPLAPAEVSPRTGLGELRPPAATPAIDTTSAVTRRGICAALALLGLGYLVRVYLVAPWWSARHRPFANAWQALRRSGTGATTPSRQQAYRQLHRALDLTAGEVVFEQGLSRFLAAHPRYVPLRAELGEFFARSRAEFFGEPSHDGAEAGRWLRALCRRCRDLERGAA
jgi:mxaA protein